MRGRRRGRRRPRRSSRQDVAGSHYESHGPLERHEQGLHEHGRTEDGRGDVVRAEQHLLEARLLPEGADFPRQWVIHEQRGAVDEASRARLPSRREQVDVTPVLDLDGLPVRGGGERREDASATFEGWRERLGSRHVSYGYFGAKRAQGFTLPGAAHERADLETRLQQVPGCAASDSSCGAYDQDLPPHGYARN